MLTHTYFHILFHILLLTGNHMYCPMYYHTCIAKGLSKLKVFTLLITAVFYLAGCNSNPKNPDGDISYRADYEEVLNAHPSMKAVCETHVCKPDTKFNSPTFKVKLEPHVDNSVTSHGYMLTKHYINVALNFNYSSDHYMKINRIEVIADNFSWKSDNPPFTGGHYKEQFWQFASMYFKYHFDETHIKDVAVAIANSKHAMVRFVGDKETVEFEVTEAMKTPIRAAIEAYNEVHKG